MDSQIKDFLKNRNYITKAAIKGKEDKLIDSIIGGKGDVYKYEYIEIDDEETYIIVASIVMNKNFKTTQNMINDAEQKHSSPLLKILKQIFNDKKRQAIEDMR